MRESAGSAPRAGIWRRGSILWWVFWIALGLVGAAGLGRMHINNSLEAWSPQQTGSGRVETYVVVGCERGDVDIPRLEIDLRGLPSVAWCIGPASGSMLRAVGVSPDGLAVGAHGDYVGVYCFAKPGVEPSTLMADVNRALSEFDGARFALGGSAVFAAALNDVSQRRMPTIVGVIAILGGGMLWILTRSIRAAASGLGAISLAMVVLVGSACWAGVDFDMSLLLVPPLMISLGYSYAAHAALRRDATTALAICGTTSMLGIAAFGTTDLPSIRSFALWGTIGVALVWGCVMSLVPPPSPARACRQDPVDACSRLLLLRSLRRGGGAILVCGVMVGIAGVLLAPRLAVDAQPLNYFAASERIASDNAVLESRLTGMLPFEVVGGREGDVMGTLRGSSYVRKAIDVSLFDRGGGGDQVIWCLANNSSLDQLEDEFLRWERNASADASTLRVKGVAPQLLEVRRQMRRVAGLSIPAMLVVAAVATGVLGGSLRAALAGLLVNLIPVAGVVVLGVAFGWSTQMPTLMVGAIGIGAGIDDAIHIVWLSRRYSIARSLRICLRACAGSSLIAAACMMAFALSPFRPTAQFGLLMALILALAAIADMIVLPAILIPRARVVRCPHASRAEDPSMVNE